MKLKKIFLCISLCVFIVLSALILAVEPAQALTLGFEAITANTVGNPEIGEAQLFVDVVDPGTAGQVLFTFRNIGPVASSICDVYFDDGTLLGIAALIDADDGVGGDAGVDFSLGASPGNLPGGNNAVPPFVTTAGFSADSDSPAESNGVNPGESLGILFDLQSGRDYGDVLADLESGNLRIGIHAQAIGEGGSEAFVNDGDGNGGGGGEVPEPAALLLVGSGLLVLAFHGRRKFRR